MLPQPIKWPDPWDDFTPEELTRAADALGWQARYEVQSCRPGEFGMERPGKWIRFTLVILGERYNHVILTPSPDQMLISLAHLEISAVWEALTNLRIDQVVLAKARAMFRPASSEGAVPA